MRYSNGSLHLSATDLIGHLACQHLTALDKAVAQGKLKTPKVWNPHLETLWKRGLEHERQYVDHLEKSELKIVRIDGKGIDAKSAGETLAAMKAGADVIVQAALSNGTWEGRADVLLRVPKASALGDWSYEVTDTKLARQTKGGTILQLCLYADLIGSIQGHIPEFVHVVSPWSDFEPESFRTTDYIGYYRFVQRRLQQAVTTTTPTETYPEPKEHCDICRWYQQCDTRRRDDDHLCLVAGISKLQIGELERREVESTGALGKLPLPITWKPERGSAQSYVKVREQARVQVEGRTQQKPIFEPLEVQQGFGLTRLPEPSTGDVFFDFEGDPFVGEAGLEYLFGNAFTDDNDTLKYTGKWALTRDEERQAFEEFVDWIMARWQADPNLHIYHYAPYEPAALKRLMGRYGTREDEVDRMLRAGLFVDLYGIIRQSIRASVESYSIKQLEQFYDFKRTIPLAQANAALSSLQSFLELNDESQVTEEEKMIVEGYNRDDCISARRLRDWLESIREHLVAGGAEISRLPPETGAPPEKVDEWSQRVSALHARLTAEVPTDEAARTPDQQARWILGNILDWHRREGKAGWWEYFRLSALTSEDLFDEGAALSGLQFLGPAGGTTRAPIHRYEFPIQEVDLRGGEGLRSCGGEHYGSVDKIDVEARTIDIKKRQDTAGLHAEAVFAHDDVKTKVLAESLFRIGSEVADKGISGQTDYRAAAALLLRQPPHFGAESIQGPTEGTVDAARRLATKLNGHVLPIQGPPGAGKTFTGARMICELVRSGARVGITANSHKVIRNILNEVDKVAAAWGVDLRAIQKVGEKEDPVGGLSFTTKNEELFDGLSSTHNVAAGTAWLWARPEAFASVDVLVVDEAAQMSLANVLAVSQAGHSLVLLGDPQQLDQPLQGSHPEGTEVSALNHILGGHQTIEQGRGLFLAETWRLHPDICAFTSEVFYENRLKAKPGLERQEIVSKNSFKGSGLRFVPVQHTGNQNSSLEEADRIARLVLDHLDGDSSWIDREGKQNPLTLDDVLIIAPYNAQVFELRSRLPGARVGTVDKFQGQEAPIVVYSMTTSTPSDAPHGMEFLYSLNRLNVATSRAKCLCVLVASPDLLEPECRTPRQIQLANALCRYRELATEIA